jgi:hypothetical protein
VTKGGAKLQLLSDPLTQAKTVRVIVLVWAHFRVSATASLYLLEDHRHAGCKPGQDYAHPAYD